MKNIYLIPTDKPNRLIEIKSNKISIGAEILSSSDINPQNIYFGVNESNLDIAEQISELFKEKRLDKLIELLQNEHNLILLDTEIEDIRRALWQS